MKNTNTAIISTAAEIYARTNAADLFTFAKPMQGVWYYFTCEMTAENIAALISTVEPSDEGAKFRFRPSNGAFYRVAKKCGATVRELASVEYVDALVVEIAAETGSRVNRGVAVEKLVSERFGCAWKYDPMQAGFWCVPDMFAECGKIQVKAYGGSVTEADLHQAVAATV